MTTPNAEILQGSIHRTSLLCSAAEVNMDFPEDCILSNCTFLALSVSVSY